MSKDEIEKKTQSHKKIVVKRMRMKIKIRNKLEGLNKLKFEG